MCCCSRFFCYCRSRCTAAVAAHVVGGGHVVLPLISSNINLSQDTFITAYSLAQAVPGPMFTIASYLGASFLEDSPIIGALVATLAIFLPGFLLIITFKDSFQYYSKNRNFARFLQGVNASVVGILFSVFLVVVLPNGIANVFDFIFASFMFFMMRKYKISILWLILIFIIYGILGSLYV